MWLGICLLVLAPAAFGCIYDGKTYKNGDTGKTGWFTFECVIKEDKSWEVKISGCIWKLTGETLKVGETKTVGDKTGRCYREGDITHFEEKLDCKENCEKPESGSEGSKTSSESAAASSSSESKETKDKDTDKPTGAGTTKGDTQCEYNSKKYKDGEDFREGQFKFLCKVDEKGWKVDVVACFVKEEGSSEAEIQVGQEKKIKEMLARCYKEGDMTMFELKPMKRTTTDEKKKDTTETAKKTKTTNEEKPTTKGGKNVKVAFTKDESKKTKVTKTEEKKPEQSNKEKLVTLVQGVIKKAVQSTKKTETGTGEQKGKTEAGTSEGTKTEVEQTKKLAVAVTKLGKTVAKAAKEYNVLCKHNEKKYKDGQEWTDEYFKYKCSTEKFTWKVEVISCFWPKFQTEVAIGDTAGKDGWLATCKPKGDGRVDFEEKLVDGSKTKSEA